VIEVVEYDEAWPVRAAAARADLISLGVFDAVEHIGSTAVPGLAAKPVVDLMAAAASLDAGLKPHRHHQHHDPGGPAPVESDETPDPVRLNRSCCNSA
jgi:GrpB-like predicted nucleotidyltransferase (UPF0157 family)